MEANSGIQNEAHERLLLLGKLSARHGRAKPLQSIPRDERKEVILDRIVDFLNREGSSEADWTLSQLARAANTSRVTLYEYFGNLDGVRAAVRVRLVGRVKPLVQKLDDIPPEDRPRDAVAAWMSWIDENRALAIRALWIDESRPAFAGFVAQTADSLLRQIAEVYLGVTNPVQESAQTDRGLPPRGRVLFANVAARRSYAAGGGPFDDRTAHDGRGPDGRESE